MESQPIEIRENGLDVEGRLVKKVIPYCIYILVLMTIWTVFAKVAYFEYIVREMSVVLCQFGSSLFVFGVLFAIHIYTRSTTRKYFYVRIHGVMLIFSLLSQVICMCLLPTTSIFFGILMFHCFFISGSSLMHRYFL